MEGWSRTRSQVVWQCRNREQADRQLHALPIFSVTEAGRKGWWSKEPGRGPGSVRGGSRQGSFYEVFKKEVESVFRRWECDRMICRQTTQVVVVVVMGLRGVVLRGRSWSSSAGYVCEYCRDLIYHTVANRTQIL